MSKGPAAITYLVFRADYPRKAYPSLWSPIEPVIQIEQLTARLLVRVWHNCSGKPDEKGREGSFSVKKIRDITKYDNRIICVKEE